MLGGVRPTLKVRRMKTRWGVCMPGKRQITLNLRLAEKPLAAVEYVVVHEYAHFVHCDHSPAFWAVVARILPDCDDALHVLRAASYNGSESRKQQAAWRLFLCLRP